VSLIVVTRADEERKRQKSFLLKRTCGVAPQELEIPDAGAMDHALSQDQNVRWEPIGEEPGADAIDPALRHERVDTMTLSGEQCQTLVGPLGGKLCSPVEANASCEALQSDESLVQLNTALPALSKAMAVTSHIHSTGSPVSETGTSDSRSTQETVKMKVDPSLKVTLSAILSKGLATSDTMEAETCGHTPAVEASDAVTGVTSSSPEFGLIPDARLNDTWGECFNGPGPAIESQDSPHQLEDGFFSPDEKIQEILQAIKAAGFVLKKNSRCGSSTSSNVSGKQRISCEVCEKIIGRPCELKYVS
jgi:hypothetical protein